MVPILFDISMPDYATEVDAHHAAFGMLLDVHCFDFASALGGHGVHVGPEFFHANWHALAFDLFERGGGPLRPVAHAARCP